MKFNKDLIKKQHALLHVLSGLPSKILLCHDIDRLPEFILHEMACEQCFNLNKVAFLVDNPDFNLLKGVAGISRSEAFASGSSIWEDPQKFSVHMQGSPFNEKVRNHVQVSCKNCDNPGEEVFSKVAKMLDMQQFNVCSWNMKHDNHGYLIYEKMNHEDTACDNYITHGASLLGFCPIH